MKQPIKNSNNTNLTIRIVIGFYLLYLDYSILSDWQNVEESNRIFIIIFTIIFAVSALLIISLSLKTLLQNYKNQKNGIEENQIDGNKVDENQVDGNQNEENEIETRDNENKK